MGSSSSKQSIARIDFSSETPNEAPKYILGPISLTVHESNIYDKFVIVIGDQHVKNADCQGANPISLTKFIQDLIQSTTDIIDIHLEIRYHLDKTKPFDRHDDVPDITYFKDINTAFYNCLQPDKTLCPYRNARFHYSDIRDKNFYKHMKPYGAILETATTVSNIRLLLDIASTISESDPTNIWAINGLKEEMKTLMKCMKMMLSDMETFDETLAGILQHLKITRQLDNIDIETRLVITDIFLNYPLGMFRTGLKNSKDIILTRSQQLMPFLDYFVPAFLEIDDNDIESLHFMLTQYKNYKPALLNFYILLHDFETRLMDFYIIARIFRHFRNGSVSKNIIIYVGDVHAEIYRHIFDKLKFSQIFQTRSKDISPQAKYTQCIKINNLPLHWRQ